MAPTLCTAADIATNLNLIDDEGNRLVFDDVGGSSPTLTEINGIIEDIEAYMNIQWDGPWIITTETEEYHPFRGKRVGRESRFHAKVRLRNDRVLPLSSGSGDKVEVRLNEDWTDLLADGKLGPAMWEGTFYADVRTGTLWFYGTLPQPGPNMYKITYRHGFSTVPRNVKRAAILLVGSHLLKTHLTDAYVPLSEDFKTLDAVRAFEEEARVLMKRYEIFT
jgi:hypothetical protein